MTKKKIVLNPLQKLLGEDFNPALLVYIVKRSLIWIVLLTLISFTISFLYLRYTPNMYEVSTTLMLKGEEQTNILGFVDQFQKQEELFGEIELIRSPLFIKRAISTLSLQISYYEKGKVLTDELYLNAPFVVESIAFKDSSISLFNIHFNIDIKDQYSFELSFSIPHYEYEYKSIHKFNDLIKTPYLMLQIIPTNQIAEEFTTYLPGRKIYFVINNIDVLVKWLMNKIAINIINPQAKTISISMRDPKAHKAAHIVDAIAQEYLKYDMEQKMESANSILSFIESQIHRSGLELEESEQNLKKFKQQNKIINPENEGIDILSKFNTYEQQQIELSFEESSLRWLYDFIKEDKDLNAVSAIIFEKSFSTFSKQINLLIELETQKKKRLLTVTQEDINIEFLDSQIKDSKIVLLKSIENGLSKISSKKQLLNKQIYENEKQFQYLSEKESEYIRLVRLNEIKAKFYLLLLEKHSEFEITKEGLVSKKIILQKAGIPKYPIYPKKTFIRITGILSGLLVGILLIMIKYLLHNKILSYAELERYCDAAILGTIPKYKGKLPIPQPLVTQNPKSLIAEAFRSIRTNMQFIATDHDISVRDGKIIAITSTLASEGKTFNALNIAGVFSLVDKKVILLDHDMRKPRIHTVFEVDNTKGISTILIGKHTLKECIHHTSYDNFDIICSGPIPPNPGELILSKKNDELFEQLRKKYDYIIIDTPPVGVVVDALELLKKIDYPIYILRAGYSNRAFINNVNRLVNEKILPKLSVILNEVGQGPSLYNYGYSGYEQYHKEEASKKGFLKRIFS